RSALILVSSWQIRFLQEGFALHLLLPRPGSQHALALAGPGRGREPGLPRRQRPPQRTVPLLAGVASGAVAQGPPGFAGTPPPRPAPGFTGPPRPGAGPERETGIVRRASRRGKRLGCATAAGP